PSMRFRKMFSPTLSEGTTIDRWYTQATRSCHAARSPRLGAGPSCNSTVPRSGLSSPVRTPTSVDLPAPLRPTSAWHSPADTETDTFWSAFVRPNDFQIASASAAGGRTSAARPLSDSEAELIYFCL